MDFYHPGLSHIPILEISHKYVVSHRGSESPDQVLSPTGREMSASPDNRSISPRQRSLSPGQPRTSTPEPPHSSSPAPSDGA